MNKLQNYKLRVTSYTLQVTGVAFCFLLSAFCFLPAALNAQEMKMVTHLKNGSVIKTPIATIDSITFSNQEDIEEGVVINGIRWATRNVDAHGQFVANPEDYGGYYQWGRRGDGHEQLTSATTTTLSDTDTPPHGDFILVSDEPRDWRTPQNDNLWGTTKTANDPSPAGWRVPTYEELKSLTDTNYVTHVWTTENGVIGYRCTDKATGNFLFLPAAGVRYYSNGSFNYAGTYGHYWSSSPNGISADHLFFYSGSFHTNGSLYRAYGYSVRCVADE